MNSSVHQAEEGRKLWGSPTTFSEIAELFSRYCTRELKALPWCDQTPSSETSLISNQLARMNEYGFLTINSQPAVNGARSDDPVVGWGPANGYVYQKVGLYHVIYDPKPDVDLKAYLEFMVSPSQLTTLLPLIEKDPNFVYYAIKKNGDLRTNAQVEGPNAVTWGVFPGKEIVQPTIVEAVSFMAWKVCFVILNCNNHESTGIQDEAFELGLQWAQIYEPNSPSHKLITEMMNTFYLVNVVHNDFHNQDAIFTPFFKIGSQSFE